jgi:hypothetical protein
MFPGSNNDSQEIRHSRGQSVAIINDAEAASFLEVIVNGVDPTTGTVLSGLERLGLTIIVEKPLSQTGSLEHQ